MPLYDYRCIHCGERWTEFRQMKDAGDRSDGPTICFGRDLANHDGKRVYSAATIPNFTEDRLRLWRNTAQGGRFSNALGCDMPETRKELERLAQEKGIEFVSPSAMPDEWKEAVEYKAHVDSGGERLEDPNSFYDVSGFNAGDTRPDYMKEKVQ